MNYRIVLEGGIMIVEAKMALDEIERMREALKLCQETLVVLEDAPRPYAVIKPGRA